MFLAILCRRQKIRFNPPNPRHPRSHIPPAAGRTNPCSSLSFAVGKKSALIRPIRVIRVPISLLPQAEQIRVPLSLLP